METGDEVRRGTRIWIIKNIASVFIFGALAFAAAGRLDWTMAWVFVATMAVNVVIMLTVIGRRSPGLLAERSGLQQNTKPWDPPLAILTACGPLLVTLIAGLDQRFGWTRPPAIGVSLAMLVPVLAGWALVDWAMASNRFFAATVRIQAERGHAVASSGPYGMVRHPGYSGAIVACAAMPLMLGSVWGFVPSAVSFTAIVVRTALEDRTLRAELPGYKEYCNRTRYRLVPGIW